MYFTIVRRNFMKVKEHFFVPIKEGIDFIGDIHGCFDEFILLLEKLGYEKNSKGLYLHPKGRKIMSVGDICSRGPKSIETLQFFCQHVKEKLAYMTDSNHGWKIGRWLAGRKVQLKHGDEKVKEEFQAFEKQFGIEKTVELKKECEKLLMNAPSHYILLENNEPTVVCTHAGIKDHYIGKDSSKIRDFCRYGDVAGIADNGKPVRRDWFQNRQGNLLIIWGHDPKKEPLIINNTINIDQGVVFGGKLTAFRYPEKEFVFVSSFKDYSIGTSNNPFK